MSAVEPPFLAGLRQEFERVAEADAVAGRPAPRRRPRLRSLRLRVALPVLTAFALLAAIAVVATGAVSLSIDLGGSDPAPIAAPGETAAGGFSEELRARIGVLGRVRSESDAIDPSLVGQLSPTLRLEQSLRVVPPPGAEPAAGSQLVIWLVPTDRGGVAITAWTDQVGEAIMLTEVDASGLESGRAFAIIGERIFGVVPDGVDQVTVRHAAGPETVLPVHDNVFIGRFEGDVPSVTWEGMRGP